MRQFYTLSLLMVALFLPTKSWAQEIESKTGNDNSPETIQITFSGVTDQEIMWLMETDEPFEIDWGDGVFIHHEKASFPQDNDSEEVYMGKAIKGQFKGGTIRLKMNPKSIKKFASSFQGISSFVPMAPLENLSLLMLNAEQLKSLSLDKMPALKTLQCTKNRALKELDLSSLSELEYAFVQQNGLQTLTLGKHPKLKEIIARNNKLEHINVNGLPLLEQLSLHACPISTLDISNNPNLKVLRLTECAFSSEELDKVYRALPQADKEIAKQSGNYYKIFIDKNPGAKESHTNLIIDKGWTPDVIGSTENPTFEECITLTLSPDHPETIKLKVVADGDWTIEGVKESAASTNRKTAYTPTGQTIKLTGNIRELDCASAHISALDLTASSKLQKLDCSLNAINTLDLSTHKELVRLDCNSNNLTTLSVANNKKLIYLDCGRNQIQSMNLSCSLLEEFNCGVNQLSELNLASCPALNMVMCHQNKIRGAGMKRLIENLPKSAMDGAILVIVNTKANDEQNVCSKNDVARLKTKQWDAYDWSDGNFEKYAGSDDDTPTEQETIRLKTSKSVGDKISMIIDGSSDISCSGLKEQLVVQNNKVTEYTITSSEIILSGSSITLFSCTKGEITEADFTHAPSLTSLNISSNALTSLDLSTLKSLQMLHCGINKLTKLDLSALEELQTVNCVQNALTSLDLSHNTKLTFVNCASNKLTDLQVAGESLQTLSCYGNQIKTLDLTGCPNIVRVEGFENALTNLNVSQCPNLELLYCGSNKLTSLDLSHNTKLKELGCGSNSLENLDVSQQKELSLLYVTDNKLKSLVLSPEAVQLERIDCYHNQLSGAAMDRLVATIPSVPAKNFAEIYLYDSTSSTEGNKATEDQVQTLRTKGWSVYDQNGEDPLPLANETVTKEELEYSVNLMDGELTFIGAKRDCKYYLFDVQGQLLATTTTDSNGFGTLDIPSSQHSSYILYGGGQSHKLFL